MHSHIQQFGMRKFKVNTTIITKIPQIIEKYSKYYDNLMDVCSSALDIRNAEVYELMLDIFVAKRWVMEYIRILRFIIR